jgi:uncharacterized membrane protein YgcG
VTPELEDTLARWEAGDVSRDELARRFPDEDIAGLLWMFEGMQELATGPTPDATQAWNSIREELPVRLAHLRRRRPKPIRLLAAALVALLVIGASAYAFVPGARRALNDALGLVTGSEHTAPAPTDLTPHPSPAHEDPAGEEGETEDGSADIDPDGEDGNAQGEDEGQGGEATEQNEQGEDEGTGTQQGSSDDGGSADRDQGTQGSGGGSASQEGSGGGDQEGGGQDDGKVEPPPAGDENSQD